MSERRYRIALWSGLAAVLLCTLLAYWPGTHGGFLLDDYPNIVQNPAMHLHHLTAGRLLRAAFSSNNGPLDRPLAMASFALNIAATGMRAGPMKITNLLIHLANGVLVFILMRLLLDEYRRLRPGVRERTTDLVALVVTAAWLLAPINLTSVLYVVQRMTSLSATFMLAGLITYVAGRRHLFAGTRTRSGVALLLCSALLFTPLAIITKEIGALTPVYAFVIEWVFFGLREADGRRSRATIIYFVAFLVVPAIVGLTWLLPRVLNGAAWAGRSYNLPQRLLTEGRVIWHYLYWTLVPNDGALTLYHDGFPVSRALFTPWSTLPAWLGIAALFAGGILLRRRQPLVSFALLWFLAGQALTGTIIPLELVFEHRMYLPDLGLFTGVFAPLLLVSPQKRYQALRVGAATAVVLLYAATLALRATDWSNPLVHMAIAARDHPESPRATYGYGRILADLAGEKPAVAPRAFAALEKAMHVPGQSTIPESALIVLAHRTHRAANLHWYRRMAQVLAARPPTPQDISGLYSLVQCGLRARDPCDLNARWMHSIFAAALDHKPSSQPVEALYGNYLLNVTRQHAKAVVVFEALASNHPRVPIYHYDLGVAAAASGDLAMARRELARLRRLNHLGMDNPEVHRLARLIDETAARNASTR